MGTYFQADVVTKDSLGSSHPFSLTAEFPNLLLGFGNTTVQQDWQSQQLGVAERREKTEKSDNSVIFPHQVLGYHGMMALFGPCSPVLACADTGREEQLHALLQTFPKCVSICERSGQGKFNHLAAVCTRMAFQYLYETFHTTSWSFAGPGWIKCNIFQQDRQVWGFWERPFLLLQ